MPVVSGYSGRRKWNVKFKYKQWITFSAYISVPLSLKPRHLHKIPEDLITMVITAVWLNNEINSATCGLGAAIGMFSEIKSP
ncbi:hypothetical protein B4916_22795 [Yersinia intermedia]|nr:hypothetical protein B4916_22795 [Yersinia intermedia]